MTPKEKREEGAKEGGRREGEKGRETKPVVN